ncbi:MAG: hypothetical protein JW999_09280 [Methanotrichaceae archaeon]|nr:hypothetical protein [Methanotrichaceae archaeon]
MNDLSDLPLLSDEDERRLEFCRLPFGGLFGNTVLLRVIREITADPYREFRPKELEALTASSAPRIKNALEALVAQGLLENISSDSQRPVYKANLSSKRLMALTLLAYAVTDDRDGTDCMNDAVRHYYDERLSEAAQVREIGIFAGEEKGIRICMSDLAAEKLSQRLGEILEDASRKSEAKVQAR